MNESKRGHTNSDVYIGRDRDNGLKHFKYIDRYKNKKGKWVYVYADKNTHKKINTELNLAKRYRNDEAENQRKADFYYAESDRDKHINPRVSKTLKKQAMERQSLAYLNAGTAKDYEVSAYASIYNNSVNNLSRKKIDSGKKTVDSLLNKIGKIANNIDTTVYNAGVDLRNKLRSRS